MNVRDAHGVRGAMEEQKFKKKYIISATSVPAY